MVIDVNIHPHIDKFTARVSGTGDTHWLSLQAGGSTINVFGNAGHVEAFKMMADVFNDAFAPPPEPEPQGPPTFEDSDIPF